MLKTRIIPCLDVHNGRVVKGVNFVDLIDAGDPTEQAQFYNDHGADELTFLDITASSDNRETIYDVIENTSQHVFIPLTVGGGVRSLADMQKLLRAGADKISINSAAVANPQLIKDAAEKFGSQCVVVAIDVKKTATNTWRVFTHGGRTETSLEVISWAQQVATLGAGEILLTSMDKDGTKTGADIELYQQVTKCVTIPVIASGGIGTLDHFVDVIKTGHVQAVLAASIFHFGILSIYDVKQHLEAHNISVRKI